ncbi:M14 family metallopeptidase [Siansivirga zeaxanthinifaciens]|uniref:Peptidase M14 n=1 Tax=Siansivirga zeaxanthinifaciens CC-SAMT-1 TaxID=1454006 RepID=A0A0C5WDF2_9FLAO|nr:M14 metallopeptidase family protein [Siansivirga zeaxanthinifaciens]AJR04287.1 peptidase M14 [Siansivirga zeaxanthinifaciens CC-SAMT-1]
MQIETIQNLFLKNKEASLSHRYITNKHIEPVLNKLSKNVSIEILGTSVLNKPIYGLTIGNGPKKILMWSQMHGNESTTTKALFDLLNTFISSKTETSHILEACTLCIIPILNPDGAKAYTRINANEVDLNRDAQNLTQPESKVLRTVFNSFKPDFCYNLHGQRTIFSAGATNNIATVSFLAPAQDEACTVTSNRTRAMEIIDVMNRALQTLIPGQVGVYDDAFNINCVGDTFQSENIPTILFEAGHYPNDYARDITREYIYISYLTSLDYISKNAITGEYHKGYFDIPENDKLFLDVILRQVKTNKGLVDIGFLFQERLVDEAVVFVPKVDAIGDLSRFYGHNTINVNGLKVFNNNNEEIEIGYENDFVIINNEKISLFSK